MAKLTVAISLDPVAAGRAAYEAAQARNGSTPTPWEKLPSLSKETWYRVALAVLGQVHAKDAD